MKRKDKEQIRLLSLSELRKNLRDTREKLLTVTVQRGAKQVKNVREGAMLRRKIAVLLTVLKEKELYEQTKE